jgi:hypothetical protein
VLREEIIETKYTYQVWGNNTKMIIDSKVDILPTYNVAVNSSTDLIFIGANSFEHFCLLEHD